MSTRGPFVVRLCTPDNSQAVDVRDLQFSTSWRGGFQDATVRLNAPLNARSPMLAPFARLRIDDTRTGRAVWEGYVDLPGKSRTDEGDVWQIGAVGPQARLSDRQKPYIAIDNQLGSWRQVLATNSGMSAQVGSVPNDEDVEALVFQMPEGIAVGTNSRVSAIYDLLKETGQLVGGYEITHKEGFTAASDWRVQVIANLEGSAEEITTNHLYDTGSRTQQQHAGGASMGVDRNVLRIRQIRASGAATNINNDNHWAAVTSMRVSAMRRLQDGTYLTGPLTYPENFASLASTVVDALYWFTAELVGSDWIGPIDIAGASIESGTWGNHSDQLAYTEPTTLQQILEDWTLFEPHVAWGVFESNAANQHRFALWEAKDGSVDPDQADTEQFNRSGARYLASAQDGWDAPGGEADLRNTITVYWTDRQGREHSKTYLASEFGIEVPELEQWFIRRDADAVDLGAELGSEANADRIAEQLLTQAARPPQAGTLTVARPIHDLWAGRDVHPWEIEPGYPLLISDVDLDPLPITEVSYNDSDASAAVTLSEPVLTTDQQVNRLVRRRRRTG